MFSGFTSRLFSQLDSHAGVSCNSSHGGKEQSVWEKTREFCRRVSRIKTAESMQSVSRSSQKYRTGLQDKSSKPRAKKVTKKYENHGIAQQFRLAGTSGGALPLKAGPAPKAEQVAQCPVA